jgi:hypothetical protein
LAGANHIGKIPRRVFYENAGFGAALKRHVDLTGKQAFAVRNDIVEILGGKEHGAVTLLADQKRAGVDKVLEDSEIRKVRYESYMTMLSRHGYYMTSVSE